MGARRAPRALPLRFRWGVDGSEPRFLSKLASSALSASVDTKTLPDDFFSTRGFVVLVLVVFPAVVLLVADAFFFNAVNLSFSFLLSANSTFLA